MSLLDWLLLQAVSIFFLLVFLSMHIELSEFSCNSLLMLVSAKIPLRIIRRAKTNAFSTAAKTHNPFYDSWVSRRL